MTTACLSDDGSRPSSSKVLIIAVTYGSNTSAISFNTEVEMGSSVNDFAGDCAMSWRTSSSPRYTAIEPTATRQQIMMTKWMRAVI